MMMGTTKVDSLTPAANVQPGVTPRNLLAIALLGCFTASVFGAAPLAAWVDASPAGGTELQQAADAWHEQMQRLGVDRPYAALRRTVRDAEAARFGWDN
jgi:hypothetical protein